MVNAYLDIETSGLDSETDQIITIQFQKLDWETGEAAGPLTILKSWESSEKDILKTFKNIFGIETWGFVAHGYNLKFENDFLYERGKKYGIDIRLFSRPTIDLHPVGVLMNGGNFKGSGLDKISRKNGSGSDCKEAYENKEYEKVEVYIKQEAAAFIEFYVWLKANMPRVLLEFKASLI